MSTESRGGGLLDLIERIGNRLPDPTTLFLVGAIIVMVLSAIAVSGDWSVIERFPEQVMETVVEDGVEVERPVLDENGEPVVEWNETGNVLKAQSLLTRDGLFWAVAGDGQNNGLVKNFTSFLPLGVVLVGMLGIGVSERTGMIGAMLKTFMLIVPGFLLTPAMVFVGIMSSMAMDAGYVVLPPLAAALYKAVGRSPLAGLAAVFAGVAAGFNANLFITGLEPMLAGLATTGAQVIEPDYVVNAACNWGFMAASTLVMTLAGWAVTSFFVERRLTKKTPEDGGPLPATSEDLDAQRLNDEEKYGLKWAVLAMFATLGIFLAAIFIKGAPLEGQGNLFSRWVESIVPMIFIVFLVPGVVYGVAVKKVKNDKDVAKLMIESIAAMAPIIVLAFVAAQFIEFFKYSGLDRMLAMAGGQALGQAGLPPYVLVISFILITLVFNLFIGSMSAKYAMFAPIFIPMFMMVGIAPELTQASYRIGDSVSNIITPLNPYMIIILVFMQQYVPKGGIGTLISLMLPYTIGFTIIWCIMLLLWMSFGIPLGVDGHLEYPPPS